MHLRLSHGIPEHGPTGAHSIATIRRQHHILLAQIDGRGAPRLHHARHILGLLVLAAKQGEVLSRRHRLVLEGISPCLCSARHTCRIASHPLPWASSGRGKTLYSRLAARNGEDRGPPWGLAGSTSLPWWSLSVVAVRAAAILLYSMAIFRKGLRRQIESIKRRFFWQGT